jgi:replication factor C small subunit
MAMAKPSDIKDMILLALKGKFIKARQLLLKVMTKDGVSGIDVITSIQSEIWNLDMDDKTKLKLTEKIGDVEFRLVEGSDEFIQLGSLLAFFSLFGQ